ncbi:T9SS type A sorting domain-containing protein [candidate division KSB1 bacterium]
MKRLILFLITSIVIGHSYAQQYGWVVLNADSIPGTPDFSDVFFVNDDTGWIASGSHAEIYHTTDGGQSFEVQTTQYNCLAIWMLNAIEGYAGGTNGRVYRTIDGGDNWIAHGSMGITLVDISFPPNGEKGYACGLNGAICSIDSSGVSAMNSYVNGNLYSISFPIDSTEGWVCGGTIINHFKNSMWNLDQTNPSGNYNAIYMLDSLAGWAAGDKIIHTINGKNWSTQTNPDTLNGGRGMNGVFFLNANEGWIVGELGLIFKTSNGGSTWNIEGTGLTNAFLRGVHFTSSTNGYVVGNNKTLLKYTQISGVEEHAAVSEITIYPNPVKGELFINLPTDHTKIESVNIMDLTGRLVKSESYKTFPQRVRINLNEVESGIYFCAVLVNGKQITKKIIVY